MLQSLNFRKVSDKKFNTKQVFNKIAYRHLKHIYIRIYNLILCMKTF